MTRVENPVRAKRQPQRLLKLPVLPLALWALLLTGAWLWGRVVAADSANAGRDLNLDAIPLYGRWDIELSWWLVLPVAVGTTAVVVLPDLARRWPWRRLLGAAGVATVGWSLALAFVDPGSGGFTDIEQAYGRHIGLVDDAGGPAGFLRTYVERQDAVPVHLQAHPPGLPLVLWISGRAGLSGPAYHTALAMTGVAVAAIASLVIARTVAGERFARVAAPFVALAPAAVWHTNADVVFGGVVLAGVAMVVAATGRRGWRGGVLAAAGGAVFGGALLLSYGVALLAVPVAAVALSRRRWWVLVVSGVAGVVIVLLPLVWGFWWLDGLAATRDQYEAGVAAFRPQDYFLVANLAVFALAVGPATIAGLMWLRDARAWLVVGAGLAVVLLADLSGLSKAETERIWQPFMPLVLLAGGGVGRRPRAWLSAQVTVAVVLQTVVRSPW